MTLEEHLKKCLDVQAETITSLRKTLSLYADEMNYLSMTLEESFGEMISHNGPSWIERDKGREARKALIIKEEDHGRNDKATNEERS